MANLSKSFGLEVRRQREKLGLSQEKLAELMSVHRTHISRLELGKISPTLKLAEKAAKALNTKLSSIIAKAE